MTRLLREADMLRATDVDAVIAAVEAAMRELGGVLAGHAKLPKAIAAGIGEEVALLSESSS